MELPKEKTRKVTEFSKLKTILYGLPKVGKSTWASQIPNALFLATEDGHNHLEVFKVNISTWQDLIDTGIELSKNPKHGFKTIVIDTVDILYGHCEKYICKREGVTHLSDLGFVRDIILLKMSSKGSCINLQMA